MDLRARRVLPLLVLGALAGPAGCAREEPPPPAASTAALAAATPPGCDADDGGLRLPTGFCAAVFADHIGHARHLAVAPNGECHANTWVAADDPVAPPGGFIVALRDADRDGHAETVARFGGEALPGRAGAGGRASPCTTAGFSSKPTRGSSGTV